MNKSIACVFPETLPDERLLCPLVQVFGQVVHLQAVENDPRPVTETALIRQCREKGRLLGFTPAPLGEHRQRFLALVQDMRRRGDTYISQLSMLTLAGLNRRDQQESRQTIIDDLLHRSDIHLEQNAEQLLWQSRLIVKLGEIYDIDQEALRQALEEISSRQGKVLAALCDDDDNPFIFSAAPQNLDQETDTVLRHRLKAWTRLCFHGGKSAPGLLVTRHRTALDLLHEVYEKQQRQSPRLLATLEIPQIQSASEPGVVTTAPLGEQCRSLSMVLTTITASASSMRFDDAQEQLLTKGVSEWSEAIARHVDPAQTATCGLELYMFEGTTASALFTESYAVERGYYDKRCLSKGCIVALLTMQ